MPFITIKTWTWTVVLLAAVLTGYLIKFYAARSILNDDSIPPVLEAHNIQISDPNSWCEPLVIGMDADGNVYLGRNRIGNLDKPLFLKTELQNVIAAKSADIVYLSGMDLNQRIPLLRCADYSVVIKSPGDESDRRTLQLISLLREVGRSPTRIIKDRKKL